MKLLLALATLVLAASTTTLSQTPTPSPSPAAQASTQATPAADKMPSGSAEQAILQLEKGMQDAMLKGETALFAASLVFCASQPHRTKVRTPIGKTAMRFMNPLG